MAYSFESIKRPSSKSMTHPSSKAQIRSSEEKRLLNPYTIPYQKLYSSKSNIVLLLVQSSVQLFLKIRNDNPLS